MRRARKSRRFGLRTGPVRWLTRLQQRLETIPLRESEPICAADPVKLLSVTTVTRPPTLAVAVNITGALSLIRVRVKAAPAVVAKVTWVLKVTVRLVTRERCASPPLIWVPVTRG